MKKRQTLNALMAALTSLPCMMACTQSYPGLEYEIEEGVENTETYTKTPIMVFVNEQNFFSITTRGNATRGTGSFQEYNHSANADNWKYSNSTFYVYAFRGEADAQGSGDLTSDPDLLKTAYCDSKPDLKDKDFLNCLVDGPDYQFGMPTKPNADGVGALEPDANDQSVLDALKDIQMYYSNVYQEVGFNFFGYYLDDLKETAECHRTRDSIYYNLTIDGTQDLMCGYAPKLDMKRLEEKYSQANITNSEDKKKIVNIGGYSTFAAHRGIYPIIDMKHQLTQFEFYAYPGEAAADSIIITGITMEGWSEGRMVVATTNKDTARVGLHALTDADGKRKEIFHLRDTAVKELGYCPEFGETNKVKLANDERYAPIAAAFVGEAPTRAYMAPKWDGTNEDPDWQKRNSERVGGSLMLFADSVYNFKLYYSQLRRDGRIENLTASYTIRAKANSPSNYVYDPVSGNWLFKRGTVYQVKIAVYGLQPIVVVAQWNPWESGGDVIIDPDDDDYIVDFDN